MKKTVYFLIDCSGSMSGNRANAVNIAMEKVVSEAIPEIRRQKSADLELEFYVLGFSGQYQNGTFILMDKTDLEDFDHWTKLEDSTFYGGTPTGAAIKAVVDDLEGGARGDGDPNAVAPAIILVSDGEPNGSNPTYEEALSLGDPQTTGNSRMFRKALRVAIGIDVDDRGRSSLEKFGNLSRSLLEAGIKTYYDCSEQFASQLAEVLKSVTVHASIGA